MTIKRSCTLCGMDYAPDDTITKCDRIGGGTYCGGEIQPPPSAPTPQADCLVCLDKGWVRLSDGTEIRCHRLCKDKGGHHV